MWEERPSPKIFNRRDFQIRRWRVLFQVVADCYEMRSQIVTNKIEFSRWGTVVADDKLASATIDRVAHHGPLIEFSGSSRRMDAALACQREGGDLDGGRPARRRTTAAGAGSSTWRSSSSSTMTGPPCASRSTAGCAPRVYATWAISPL